MEQVNLTNPITNYKVLRLILDWQGAGIEVLVGEAAAVYFCNYSGTEATTLMTQLNKADCSVKSMHRRILEKLIADGKISGTISGAPD